jgi:transportin-3
VDETNLPGLKTTLLASLQRYHSGPRNIIIQLCLALAALALQYPGCHDVFQTMVDSFGRNPATVPVLLQFLTVLPDELNNTRIPITVSQLLCCFEQFNADDQRTMNGRSECRVY